MNYLTIADAGAALRSGATSSVELTSRAIARADEIDALLGTFLFRCNETALAAAARSDAELRSGHDRGPLHGIPIGVKDIVATADCPTTAQSEVLDPAWGSRGDASVVARLRAAGAVVVGKTSTMEFAIGLPDPAKPFPIPRNPWATTAWTGGSSSGTASGVATGMFLGGVGTDTGGSIRSPAAWCGITGLKPTFGRVSKMGVVPLAADFDHVGPMARSALDCALLLQAMAGHDVDDPSSANVAVPDFEAALSGTLDGVRIGVERQHHTRDPRVEPSVTDRFEEALAVLVAGGAELVEVSIPDYDRLASAALVLVIASAFALHRPNLQRRWDDYGCFTRLSLAIGAFYTAADYAQALRVRDVGLRQVNELFRTVDVIATLPVGCGAPPVDSLNFAGGLGLPVFTPAWNVLGVPTMSVPIGFSDSKLPVGMQLSAPAFAESMVLRVGDAFQRHTDWHLLTPPL